MRTIGLGLLASAHATGVACGGSRPPWSPPGESSSGGGGAGGGSGGGGGLGGSGGNPDPNFHVFLLIGQSNMEGVPKPEAQDLEPNERIKVLAYDNCAASGQTYNQWYTASPPLHGCNAGVGPGDYFGRTLAEAFPNATIGLVPVAISGVDVDFFRKNVVSARRGEFRIPPDDHWSGAYEWVLERARLAQQSGKIRGIIFHQGESDNGQSVWVDKVQEIVKDLRNDLGIGEAPFLAGELLYSGCCAGHNVLVNQLPSKISSAYAISASGLAGMDNFHFDLAGQRELGKRYGEQMVTALKAQQGDWVGSWAAGPQLTEESNLPPAPGLAGNTLRQVIFTSLGGDRLRFQISNAYGTSPLELRAVHVAASTSGSSIDAASDAALTFDGSASVTIPAGEVRFSDPLELAVNPLAKLAISVAFAEVPTAVTGHPGSRTTSYIASGDAVSAATFPTAASTDHWYFLAGLDVSAASPAGAVVALGDSITDGRGSTTNGNDRWPDQLSRRLRESSAAASVSVLNLGIGGNAVLSGGLGPTALTRFERDVLDQRGVRWLIVLNGVNDIGNSSDAAIGDRLIAAYQQFIDSAHQRGILAYGVPILPFGGSQYDSATHEAARQTVNDWIRTSGKFDAVIDLEATVRDPAAPTQLLPVYDSGDHLHLSPAGYKAMADAIDLGLFKP